MIFFLYHCSVLYVIICIAPLTVNAFQHGYWDLQEDSKALHLLQVLCEVEL